MKNKELLIGTGILAATIAAITLYPKKDPTNEIDEFLISFGVPLEERMNYLKRMESWDYDKKKQLLNLLVTDKRVKELKARFGIEQ